MTRLLAIALATLAGCAGTATMRFNPQVGASGSVSALSSAVDSLSLAAGAESKDSSWPLEIPPSAKALVRSVTEGTDTERSAASPQGTTDSLTLTLTLAEGTGTAWIYPVDSLTVDVNTMLRLVGPSAFGLGLAAMEAIVTPGDTVSVRVLRGPTFITAFAFRTTNSGMGYAKDGGRQHATPIVPMNWYGYVQSDTTADVRFEEVR